MLLLGYGHPMIGGVRWYVRPFMSCLLLPPERWHTGSTSLS